jgi:hypothetical protein
LFPYDSTPTEDEEQHRWEKIQLKNEANQRRKNNFTIKVVNFFRSRNDKIKLKEVNSFSDHARLYKAWISEQKKKGKIFKYRTHCPLPWDIRPKINWNKTNIGSTLYFCIK